MSLLTEAMEDCRIMDRVTTDDGYGGYETMWTMGASIKAAIVLNTSTEARIAEAQGVKALYTITTEKNVNLEYHQVVMRMSDNKCFRVTSDGDDNKTPNSAGLNMRQVTAEEFKLG